MALKLERQFMKTWTKGIFVFWVIMLGGFLPGKTAFSQVVQKVKIGTLAPQASIFCDMISTIGNDWKSASKGQIEFQIYPNAIAGSEPDMIRKMKIGQMDAAGLTSMGIYIIDPSFTILQLPGIFNSYDELDYCRKRMTPLIDARMEKQGFKVLNYSDLGGIYFFTKKPVKSISELKKLKMCTFATDRNTKGMWSKAGFTVVDLEYTELLSSLQIGLIDGFINAPIFALANQWFGVARYMVNVNYGYMQGMTIIRMEKWNSFDHSLQDTLLKISNTVADSVLPKIRALDKTAIEQMEQFGLRVYTPPKEEMGSWLEPLVQIYPNIRGDLVPTEIFDKAFQLRDEFRKRQK
jgi:TRAP-type transport system periplasmic protein